MRGSVRRSVRRAVLAGGTVCACVLLLFMVQTPGLVPAGGFSRAVYDRHGSLLRLTLTADETYRLFVPLAQISPQLRAAVLLHEDQYFYHHFGVNPVALVRAFGGALVGRGRSVGASTITMQLARMIGGINSRTIGGKLYQILCALRLELHYSKDALLEAYLNRAAYGYNIEGVGAASLIYFRVPASGLTLPQALTLAVIPQSPARRRPETAQSDKPAVVQARNRLFARWQAAYPHDTAQAIFFKLPLAVYGRADLPRLAPHYTRDLLQRYPQQPTLQATLDSPLQQKLERLLQGYVRDKQRVGINNASAMLVDTRTMQVLASIGSADFNNPAIAGQVDGTQARRSPGSALKPFIYGLAFDQGLVHPLSIVGDTPTGFGSYLPDNFERDFRGPISVADALRFSRNIPAIKLAAQLRQPNFYEFLQQAGIERLRPAADYGLSLVLGGAEVTLREMLGLFAALAHGGAQRPLVLQTTMPEAGTTRRLLSAEASFLVLDILSQSPHPLRDNDRGAIAWKTGTSNGLHDAWTAGVFGNYALVVWVGNFNGRSNPALVGVRSAAPLFFALADALREGGHYPPISTRATGLNLRQVPVCALSGDLDLTGCASVTQGWFIPGVSPLRGNAIMRPFLVNRQTGRLACHAIAGVTEARLFEVWPSELQQALRNAGIQKPALPAWEPGCQGEVETVGTAPRITAPQSHVVYQVRAGQEASEAMLLRASADGAVQRLHWFIDNRFFGISAPEETLRWTPPPGRYHIRVVDEQGRSSAMQTLVTLAP